ncbi:Os08g0506200 [Oryza sativa Japonica Group]|uniref:Os08g0506200 protein n=1 Tax=Oryza sativa subsp. japonica TaxID=39947 RepID=C7J641_ORYSJ|nr:Os08g0506200 [Oryza sativa Japonica Group]|eukprot:NP_001175649.1 Os08g0506200 [Oryza sativa Japonica Group]
MTTLAPCAKHYTPKGLTTLLQTNPNNRHTIPKTLKWDEITLPEKWVLSQAVEPKSMDQSEVESLIETPDGDVEITFASKQKAFLQSRPSVSLDSRPRTKPQNVVYATYEDNSDEPSISDFDINVIELDVGFVIAIEEDEFEIDKDLLKRELRLQKNRPKMKRYFERVDEPFRLKIRELWHKEMREQRKNIFFFDWYESSQVRHFEEFFKRKNMIKKEQKSEAEDLTVIKKVSTEWETASGNKVDSVHPPFESVQLSHNGGKACPLKSISKNTYGETAKVEHIGHLVEQQNYANISLRSLGQQTNRIETILMEGYKTGRPELRGMIKEGHYLIEMVMGIQPVRNSLRKEGGGSINYHYLDIGKITQKIQLVGAELCNDLKIKDQLKKQRILGKREMGDFCYQFGFQDPYVHRKRKTHSKPMTKPNDKSKMSFQATKRKPKRIYNKNIRTQDTESKETICYKCGLKGHIANRCFKSKVKKEIQALLDSESEDVKEKLEAILNNIDNDSSSDEEKNAEINCCQDSGCSCCEPDNSEEESDENILVLTSLEEFVLDTFETIQDPEEKRRVLEKFLSRVKTDKDKLKKDIQKSKFLSIDEVFKRLDEQKKKNEQPDLISLFEDQKIMKQDLEEIRKRLYMLESKEGFHMEEKDEPIQEDDHVVGTIQKYMKQKWYTEVMYRFIDGSYFQHITLIDSGADVNCIREGIIPHKYFYKAAHRIRGADGGLLTVEYQIPEIYICITEVCIKTSFLLVKNLKQDVILGTPFLSLIRPFLVTNEDIQFKIMGKQVSLRFSSNTDEILDQLVQTKREQVVNTIYLHDNSFPSYLPKSMDLPGWRILFRQPQKLASDDVKSYSVLTAVPPEGNTSLRIPILQTPIQDAG